MPRDDHYADLPKIQAARIVARIDATMGYGLGKPTETYSKSPVAHPTDSTRCLLIVEQKMFTNPVTRQIFIDERVVSDVVHARPKVYEDARKAKEQELAADEN